MKKKYILVILCLVLIVLLSIYFFKDNLKTDSELVTSLYTYLGKDELETCKGLINYSDSKVDQESMDNDTKVCRALSLVMDSAEEVIMQSKETDEGNVCEVNGNIFASDNRTDGACTLKKISKDTLEEKYQEVFNLNIEALNTITYDNTTVCYFIEDNYYCGPSKEYTYTFGSTTNTYRIISKAKEKDDTITIYDYFLKVINDKCYTSFVENTLIDDCNYDEDKVNYSYLKKYGTLYKHTFKKNNDTYYWVSSEQVEK